MKTASRDAAVDAEGRPRPVNEPGETASNEAYDNSSRTAERAADRDLVRRVQEGDESAFRELFDKYNRRAFAVALGVVRNRQDALDVVQDAFIKVHRHIETFQGTSSFYTWLYRIVMNLAIDHIRRSKKSKELDYDDKVGHEAPDFAVGSHVGSGLGETNPRKTVLRKELSEAIQSALDELPEYHRAVILLREVEGLSYEEMAEILEVPKGTIMSRLFHARRKMQTELEGYLGENLEIED